MLFSIICLLLVLGVAYFHWVQGLFSGAISMALAIVAATLAIGMHESIVTGMLAGKLGDFANGIVLMVMFLAIYGIGRLVFDSVAPGNVQVPLYFDKVGGAICGLIAGICGVGVVAVAAQSMPFGPSIAGFSRHDFDETKELAVTNTNGKQVDASLSGVIKVDEEAAAMPAADKGSGLMLPVDQWLVDFAGYQSRAGALAGGRAFTADHPDLLRELFFDRVGIQTAAKRVAMNIPGRTDITLVGIFAPDALLQAEGEAAAIRKRTLPPRVSADAKSGKVLLVARLQPNKLATDTDNKFRFSTGAIRLVVGGRDYYPIGTIHFAAGSPVLMASRADDYLIGNGKAFDVVFDLDRADVLAGEAPDQKVKKDVFVEVKRFGRVDLADKAVSANLPAAENGIDRKAVIEGEITKRIAESAVLPH